MTQQRLLSSRIARRRLSWQLATVRDVRWETSQCKTIVLDVPGWAGHRPGQHVDVRLTAEDGYQAQRSYSIASAPADSHPEITVERLPDGEVSGYLVDELRPGDQLELRGPVGGYFVWDQRLEDPVTLIAGGSGIAPFRSILRQHQNVASQAPVRLLYSTRSLDEMIFRDELQEYAAKDSIDVAVTLTREQPADWNGYRRRIDTDLISATTWPVQERPLTYVCGPTPFVERAADILVELGHQTDRVLTERFGGIGGNP